MPDFACSPATGSELVMALSSSDTAAETVDKRLAPSMKNAALFHDFYDFSIDNCNKDVM